MLNPAWQPAQEHAERLLHISHHFLSADVEPAPRVPEAETVQLPVLLALSDNLPQQQEPDYLLRALTRQLNLPVSASEQTERAERGLYRNELAALRSDAAVAVRKRGLQAHVAAGGRRPSSVAEPARLQGMLEEQERWAGDVAVARM